MRIYISVDMEGASGVTRWEDVVTSRAGLPARPLVDDRRRERGGSGARAAGATEFVVEENHGVEMLCNLVLDEIDPDVDVVRGLPRVDRPPRPRSTTPSTRCSSSPTMPRSGTTPAICAHTISYGDYEDVRLDGRTISEGEIFATIAAQNGVPTALITGDDVVAAEMAKVTPGIETAIVKQALSRTGGWIVPPKRAAKLIEDAARERRATCATACSM